MLFTSTLAYFPTSGTVARRSSPEMAGTMAFLTGSIFMAMVPPVAMKTTTGWAAAATAAAARANANERTHIDRDRMGFLQAGWERDSPCIVGMTGREGRSEERRVGNLRR